MHYRQLGRTGLEVVLRDEKGVEKGRTKSGDDGKFRFDALLPGKYQLSVEKPTPPRRKGSATVTVVADQDTPAKLRLLLP